MIQRPSVLELPLGPIDLALRVTEILDRLGIPYVVGGSVASSILGEPRATADIDIAIRLAEGEIDRLIEALGADYYVSREAAVSAVHRRASFNLVHLESVQKVDLFVLGEELLDRRQLEHRRQVAVTENGDGTLWIGSPEDQVLRKLAWYRAGGGVSDRQWRDVVGILATQAQQIDRADLEGAAAELGLGDLLAGALEEAGRG
jgi:hypothetical protein